MQSKDQFLISILVSLFVLLLKASFLLPRRSFASKHPWKRHVGRCSSGQLLADNVPACREFFEKYFDDKGYLQCFVRWGANDGAG